MTLKFTRDWTHSLNNDKVENPKLQNHTKTQPVKEKTLSMKRRAYERSLISFLSLSLLNPPSIESWGTLLITHHLKPPPPPPPPPTPRGGGGEIYPLSRLVGSHAFWVLFTRNTPFPPPLSREIFPRQMPQKYPLSRDNGNCMRPRSAFEGGWLLTSSKSPPYVWNWVYSIKAP